MGHPLPEARLLSSGHYTRLCLSSLLPLPMCPKYVVITGQKITTEQDRVTVISLKSFCRLKTTWTPWQPDRTYVAHEDCRGKCKKKTESCRDNAVRENWLFPVPGLAPFLSSSLLWQVLRSQCLPQTLPTWHPPRHCWAWKLLLPAERKLTVRVQWGSFKFFKKWVQPVHVAAPWNFPAGNDI